MGAETVTRMCVACRRQFVVTNPAITYVWGQGHPLCNLCLLMAAIEIGVGHPVTEVVARVSHGGYAATASAVEEGRL